MSEVTEAEVPAAAPETVAELPITDNTNMFGFSEDEIADMAKPILPPKEEAKETEEQVADKEAAVEEQEAAKEVAKDAKPEDKPRSKYIPRDRFDDINEQLKLEREERNRDRDARLKAEDDNKKLIDFINKATGGAKPEEDKPVEDEIVDVKAYKELKGEIAEVKNKQAQEAFQRTIDKEKVIGERLYPDFQNATDDLVARQAWELIKAAKIKGITLDQKVAIKDATKNLVLELHELEQNGVNTPGALAEYTYGKAEVRGYKPVAAKAANPASRPKLDMEALNRARETAGAPAIEKQSVSINGGQWQTELANRGIKDGLSADYLAQFGMSA